MPPLPILTGREVVRVFESLGWRVARRRGSHMAMLKLGELATLSVPDHREVGRGTLRKLIRQAGLTVQDFLDALESL